MNSDANGKKWKDECGVFAIWNHPAASRLTYLGLYAIQHRGQESAGIVTLDGDRHHVHKDLGLVSEVFNDQILAALSGRAAIGHDRYSTTGMNSIFNAQPMTAQLSTGPLAIAHNGNIVNADGLKTELINQGSIFQGSSDTEVVLHLIARDTHKLLLDRVRFALERVEGAFSVVLLTGESVIAARDPHGFRPLVLGQLDDAHGDGDSGGASYVVASESCAFDLIGARLIREVKPGEIVVIDKSGIKSFFLERKEKLAQCVFEHVYFSRPDSIVFGQSVYEFRKRAGQILARETPVDVDVIIPVPDSGVPSALGYSLESRIPFEFGIIRNHYIGRTFIQPQQAIRDVGVKIKLNAQSAVLKGKRVVVVDDSLVRGTTSRKIVSLIRSSGAKEVHLRIAAPPTISPCYYGVDTPEKSQLIAANQSLESIRQFVGADSLGYLSIEGLKEAVGGTSGGYCAACFDGNYPTSLFGLDLKPKGNVRGI